MIEIALNQRVLKPTKTVVVPFAIQLKVDRTYFVTTIYDFATITELSDSSNCWNYGILEYTDSDCRCTKTCILHICILNFNNF